MTRPGAKVTSAIGTGKELRNTESRFRYLAVVTALVALAGASGAWAAAGKPYPSQHQGTGREPIAASGTFAGSRFVARSAVVRYEIGLSCCPSKTIGEVDVYLFETKDVTCKTLDDSRSKRNFSYSVEANGKALPVGRPAPSSFFQQASFNVVGLTTGNQVGIRIVFTRIDTTKGHLWHGTFRAPRFASAGKVYALSGSFAASWCGTVRS